MKKFRILLIFLLVSCSYKPIYSTNDKLIFEFNEIVIEGEEKIVKQILNNINLKKNLSKERSLLLTITYKNIETSKNSKGQITTYRSIINAEINIENEDKNLTKENFSSEFDYDNKKNEYELRKYQDEIKQNLTMQLINQIVLFLKLS